MVFHWLWFLSFSKYPTMVYLNYFCDVIKYTTMDINYYQVLPWFQNCCLHLVHSGVGLRPTETLVGQSGSACRPRPW